jgi:pyruvate/2-oxoglutarate dehydrogenase complex dihydrolipoamide dehydrogenase (E3) component
VTEASLNGGEPDVVLLAAGATAILPNIPGNHLPLVCDAFQILGGEVAPGDNVVVVGGGMIGMETADFLLDKGSKVTVVELKPKSPVSKLASHGYMLHKRLREGGGRLLLATRVEGIGEDAVTVVREESGQEKLPADQVVIAVGTKPREELKKALEEKNITYSVVGDANQPRRIIEAVDEGAKAAWEI